MQKAILILAATLAIFFGGVSDAAEIHGRVVRISDGDTLTILSPATGTTGVSPVGGAITGTTGVPPVGEAITGTTGVPPVAQHKIRLYGIDAPESHQGLARHYKRFDSTPAYAAAENEARAARRGLWPDHNPIPPEQYRHGRAGAPRTPSAATQTAAPSNSVFSRSSRGRAF